VVGEGRAALDVEDAIAVDGAGGCAIDGREGAAEERRDAGAGLRAAVPVEAAAGRDVAAAGQRAAVLDEVRGDETGIDGRCAAEQLEGAARAGVPRPSAVEIVRSGEGDDADRRAGGVERSGVRAAAGEGERLRATGRGERDVPAGVVVHRDVDGRIVSREGDERTVVVDGGPGEAVGGDGDV